MWYEVSKTKSTLIWRRNKLVPKVLGGWERPRFRTSCRQIFYTTTSCLAKDLTIAVAPGWTTPPSQKAMLAHPIFNFFIIPYQMTVEKWIDSGSCASNWCCSDWVEYGYWTKKDSNSWVFSPLGKRGEKLMLKTSLRLCMLKIWVLKMVLSHYCVVSANDILYF